MKRQLFNTGWTFEKETGDSRLKAFYGNNDAKPVVLPYDAMIRENRTENCPAGSQSGFYPGGKYIYEKSFVPSDEWKEKEVILEFEGVYGNTRVFFNGFLLHTNHNGYIGFYVDLTPLLVFGRDNVVRVEVDNSQQPNSRWYTGSGIYRNVNLWVGGKICAVRNSLRVTTKDISANAALLEVEAYIKNRCMNRTPVSCNVEIRHDGECINSQRQEISFISDDIEKMRMIFTIEKPLLWDTENPNLYECCLKLSTDNMTNDEESVMFGIRTVSVNSVDGLLINGKPCNLRGTCIHHDNGIIGAETFSEIEEYRCRKLKEAGFNAIRSAHNPLSIAMLEACDKLGMLVMDEISDVWLRHKNPYDFADYFEEEVNNWVKAIVDKDYNHPSVIIYSVGNEISEAGTMQGAYINRHLCNLFCELDSTRYTTNSLNALNCAGHRLKGIMRDVMQKFPGNNQMGGSGQGSNALNTFMSLMYGEKGEYFANHELVSEALEECSQSCDIIGLNYLRPRYETEKELHPNKTVLGTETYPAEIEELWKLVKAHPYIIGDFTWTGYDYIGEAGVGIFHYDGGQNFSNIYPERLAYIGDIDLLGNRRPISYFREIVFGLRKEPYIAVERLENNGKTPSKTAWMFKDNISSWTWAGFEGEPASVDVYSSDDEVELFLNGNSLGRKEAGENNHFTAAYQVPYEPGKLLAISYSNGCETGRYELETSGEANKIIAKRVTGNETNVAYIQAYLADDNNILNMQAKKTISVSVEGDIRLEGFGTANPSNEQDYFDNSADSFDGYVMAAVRIKPDAEKMRGVVVFEADGCESARIEIC